MQIIGRMGGSSPPLEIQQRGPTLTKVDDSAIVGFDVQRAAPASGQNVPGASEPPSGIGQASARGGRAGVEAPFQRMDGGMRGVLIGQQEAEEDSDGVDAATGATGDEEEGPAAGAFADTTGSPFTLKSTSRKTGAADVASLAEALFAKLAKDFSGQPPVGLADLKSLFESKDGDGSDGEAARKVKTMREKDAAYHDMVAKSSMPLNVPGGSGAAVGAQVLAMAG